VGEVALRGKDQSALDEIIARVNQFFVGELTEGDKLLYVNNALKGSGSSARR
jgi:type I restriction enzyme R subunit